MLEVKDMVVAYGRVNAVKGISFTVEKGQIVTLLGTNGAGKSTTLRAISGLLKLVSGSITFEGEKLDGIPAHKIVERGIAQSPEGRRLFRRMSVEDNLKLGAFSRKDAAGVKTDLAGVYELFPVLGERRHQAAGLFSGGEQQMLAIGRAMMSRPKLLMLDEPSMGLSPIMTQTIMRTILKLQSERRHDPARRAERLGRPVARRSWVRPRGRADHVLRHREGASRRRPRSEGVPRRQLNQAHGARPRSP